MSETSFVDLGVRTPLVRALAEAGIEEPFPIQISTLPDSLAGRDVLGRGKTGSGKTLAFLIPIVSRLAGELGGGRRRSGRPLALVLAPTRELATQIATALEPLATAHDLKVTTIFGGVAQGRQVASLKSGVDVVIACPGRLEDLLKQRMLTLDAVEITVLDEADHMADLGFLPVVTRLLAATPPHGQRLLFSATLDNGVDKLVKRFMSNPIMHSVDEAHSPVAQMTHHVFEVAGLEAKKALVRTLASGKGRRILFMRTKHQAKKLAKTLTDSGIPSVDLHGNLSQGARDRNLQAFSDGHARVLVATDVAARGVHVDDVELVVHVDPPAEHKAYLHRSGRTARAGSEGTVVTVSLPEQRKDLAVILKKAAIDVRPVLVAADSAQVTELVGDVADWVKPPSKQPATHTQRSAPSRRRPRAASGAGEVSRRDRPRRAGHADRGQTGGAAASTRGGAARGGQRRQGGAARARVER